MELEKSFKDWLRHLAESWDMTIDDVTMSYAESEIENRINEYSNVKKTLTNGQFDLQLFANAARKCWILEGQFDAIRFNDFISHDAEAAGLILTLIFEFPSAKAEAAERVDGFVEDAILLSYSTPKGVFDRAGAAQLASLILTACFPEQFVDYRQGRWVKLAKALNYSIPPKGSSHGDYVVWAGNFAQKIVVTETYQEYWPRTFKKFSWPLWVVAGLCWGATDQPGRPDTDPLDPEMQFFPEGAEKRRLHLYKERNRTVVRKAKANRIKTDPSLHCDVCGFSYIECYGKLGAGFIEAHHITPISELGKGGVTKVDDLAMLCANCHRMIHVGEKTLSIETLKTLLNAQHNG